MKLTESHLRQMIRQELRTDIKNNRLGESDAFHRARETNARLNAQLDREEGERMADNTIDMMLELKAELVKAFKIVAVASVSGGAASTALAVWLSENPEFVDQIKELIAQASK